VEEQFYFLWPVTFIWLNRRRQYLVPALAAPIVVALLFHTVVYAQKVPWIIHPLFHPHSSFVNFDSLAVGCATAFALAQWRHRITGWLTRRNRLLAAAAGVGLVLLPSLDLAVARPVWAIFGNLFQAAGLALLLLTSALQPRGFAPLSWRVVVQLGVVSYSIYVWQQIFYAAPDIYATRNIWWLSFPMWLVPVLLVSFASYYGFERPLLKLRTRFRRTVL
jgi:peptidoglycan/LPS O-acetylase OafA/YrhL